jgi:hypothetical protein
VTDLAPSLARINEEPRDPDRWLVLCDALEQDGEPLGPRLRKLVEVYLSPRQPGLIRQIADMFLADPSVGPRAGVLRQALGQADRLAGVLRRGG